MGYTVTEKGTVTIPAELRRKYGLKRGSKVSFIETEQGVVLLPAPRLAELFGVDKNRKRMIYAMIRELEEERRREASER